MSIEKLIEFATTGDKNTDELDLERGFPSRIYPARQWFNWLFNSLTSKINEIIENKVDKSDLSEISQDEANKGISTESKLISAKVLKNAIAQHVPINNTLTSLSTSQALSAAQGHVLSNQMFGINQTVKDISLSIVSGSTYTNTGTKLKMISVYTEKSNRSTGSVRAFINNESWGYMDTDGNDDGTFILPIPPNSIFRLDIVGYIVGQTIFVKELS